MNVKIFLKLISSRFARAASSFLEAICYAIILLLLAGMVVSIIGRQTFVLHTGVETFPSAIYSEENHEWKSRGLTTRMDADIHVFAGENGGIVDFGTQAGLSAMYAATAIPVIISFWLLRKMFRNITNGEIFTEQNARYLLYYGLIQIAVAVLVPLVHLLIRDIANHYTGSQIHISSSGRNLLSDLIPNIAYFVAAYIIHYGVHLQDEADHTL